MAFCSFCFSDSWDTLPDTLACRCWCSKALVFQPCAGVRHHVIATAPWIEISPTTSPSPSKPLCASGERQYFSYRNIWQDVFFYRRAHMLTEASLLRLVNLIMPFCFVLCLTSIMLLPCWRKSWFRGINVEHDRAPL